MLNSREQIRTLVAELRDVLSANRYIGSRGSETEIVNYLIKGLKISDLLLLYELYNQDVHQLARALYRRVGISMEYSTDGGQHRLTVITLDDNTDPEVIDNLHRLSDVETVLIAEPNTDSDREYILSQLRRMPSLSTVYFYDPLYSTPDYSTIGSEIGWIRREYNYDNSGIRYLSVVPI